MNNTADLILPNPLAAGIFQLAAYRTNGWRLTSLHAKRDGENLDIAGSREVAKSVKELLNASFSGSDLNDRLAAVQPGVTISQVQFTNQELGRIVTITATGRQIVRDISAH